MASNEIKNGQREYGIVHVVEEEMMEAGDGVFARKRRAASANKMESAPENKAVTSATSPTRKARKTK